MIRLTLLLCFVLINSNTFSQNIIPQETTKKWEEKFKKNGVLGWVNTTCPDDHLEVKATVTIPRHCSVVLNELNNVTTHSDWMFMISESKVIKSISSLKTINWYYLDFPWPVSNQDIVSEISFSKYSSNQLLFKTVASPDSYVDKGLKRVKYSDNYYLLTQVESNSSSCLVEFGAKTRKIGIPDWLTFTFTNEVPESNLTGLKKQCENSNEDYYNYDWLGFTLDW